MSLKNIFFGKQYEPLSNRDALKIFVETVLFGIFMAYFFFSPSEYSLWGLIAKYAIHFDLLP